MSDAFPLTTRELATRLRVTERTIQRWVRAGRLPYWRVGRRIVFLPEQVREIESAYSRGVRVTRPEALVRSPYYEPHATLVSITSRRGA